MEVERLKPPLDDCGKDMVVSTEKLRLFLFSKIFRGVSPNFQFLSGHLRGDLIFFTL